MDSANMTKVFPLTQWQQELGQQGQRDNTSRLEITSERGMYPRQKSRGTMSMA
jgi:hypothetical protein